MGFFPRTMCTLRLNQQLLQGVVGREESRPDYVGDSRRKLRLISYDHQHTDLACGKQSQLLRYSTVGAGAGLDSL